jgi:hypothetical protein
MDRRLESNVKESNERIVRCRFLGLVGQG